MTGLKEAKVKYDGLEREARKADTSKVGWYTLT
jgi:hypothetical protein